MDSAERAIVETRKSRDFRPARISWRLFELRGDVEAMMVIQRGTSLE